MQDRRKTILLLSAIGAVVIAIIVILIIGLSGGKTQSPAPETPSSQPQSGGSQGKRIIDVQRQVLINDIEEGICDMGLLVTQEYYFTEVISYSSVKKLFKTIKLGITESSYLASYDGVISAGLDFEKISVEKNDEERIITIRLPKSEVKYMQIDPESFVLYSEKEGLGNRISLSDYNDSLIELEQNAEKKAVDRGLLKRADENARLVISNFVNSLVDTSDYMVRYVSG